MITLKPDSLLQRIRNINLQLDAGGEIKIQTEEGVVRCPQHGLAVLDAFSKPTPFAVALDRLKARGEQHWMDLTNIILRLHQAGVLQDPELCTRTNFLKRTGFGAARIHVQMLNDRARTASFLTAIREVVRPGDIVLDIGTGTGVLAIAAAQAGAAHVYAVEAGAMAEVANAMFARQGLSDRITLLRGWSTEIQLPALADVLVTETIGNDPFNERILEITRDARKRLLKPDARLIPQSLAVYGLPLGIPPGQLNEQATTEDTLEDWKSWYDIDFTPLAEAANLSSYPRFYVRPQTTLEWQAFSGPVVLAESKFDLTEELIIDRTFEINATASGLLNGLLVYFKAGLGPTTTLSTNPSQTSKDTSWRHPVWYFNEGLSLKAGDRFALNFRSGQNGRLSQARLLRPG